MCIILATKGLPGCERVLDGCELTVDVAAIIDKFSGLAVAVTVTSGLLLLHNLPSLVFGII